MTKKEIDFLVDNVHRTGDLLATVISCLVVAAIGGSFAFFDPQHRILSGLVFGGVFGIAFYLLLSIAYKIDSKLSVLLALLQPSKSSGESEGLRNKESLSRLFNP